MAQAKKALDTFKNSLPSTMIMKEKATPRDAFILSRGEYDQPTDKVGRGLPAILPPLPEGEPVNPLGAICGAFSDPVEHRDTQRAR